MQHRANDIDDTVQQTRNYAPLQAQNRPDAGRRGADPLDYAHRHDSLRRFAELLALRYDLARTRQAYYRQLRLIGDQFQADPGTLTEDRLRDYFLHVKTSKGWKPKTIRQAVAAARQAGFRHHLSVLRRADEKPPALPSILALVARTTT